MRGTLDNGYLYLDFQPGEARWAAKAAKVPGCSTDKSGLRLRFLPTEVTRGELLKALGGWAKVAVTVGTTRALARKQVSLPGDFIPGARPDPPPWPHQVAGFWEIVNSESRMMGMGMGTGKTRTLVEALGHLRPKLTLLIVPKSKVNDWVDELMRWRGLVGTPLTQGSIYHKLTAAKEAAAAGRAILVINPDSVWREPLAAWIEQQQWDVVAVDESQSIKSPTSKVSKFCEKLTRISTRRVNLTGTPMAHSPVDVFGQYRFLDPGVFGTVYGRFTGRYVVMSGANQSGKLLGYTNEEEMSKKYHSIAFEAPRSLLTLPPVLPFQDVVFDLSDAERKAYDEMLGTLVAYINTDVVEAPNLGVRLMKLQQLASGFAIDSPTGLVRVAGTSKFAAVGEWIDELGGEPAVLFTRFTYQVQELLKLCAARGVAALEMSGRVNDLPRWQAGAGQVLVAQHKTGSIGVDMTRACLGGYVTPEFSLNTWEQSQYRLDRPGQTRPITYTRFIAANTVDIELYNSFALKQDIIRYIMELYRGKKVA